MQKHVTGEDIFWGALWFATLMAVLMFGTCREASADPYDTWCSNLGAVCRSECEGVRHSYDHCGNSDECDRRRRQLDEEIHDRCMDDCRDRQEARCDARAQ